MSNIPYSRQSISEADCDAVLNVLNSGWLTQGPIIDAFELAISSYTKAQHGIAVMNATAALHLACLALEVQPGDYVWTSPNTFLASANCARYCGAEVDFVDICKETYNMSVSSLSTKLENAAKENKLPKVVIPVHFSGQSCDMKEIKKLSDYYGFKIIEDASHAIGGRYCDEPIGSCRYSDMTIFSFHPVKIITTGEGGIVLTNQKSLAEKIVLLRSHGITRNENLMTHKSEGAWYYQQINLGHNYRISDIQCALGLSQMNRLDEFVMRRNERAMRYNEKLKNLPLILPTIKPENYSSFHLYVVQLDRRKTNRTRKEVFDALRSAKVGVNVHYIPVHLQPYYQALGYSKGDFLVAETYYQNAISLPLYSDFSEAQQDYVIEKLKEILE